MSSTAKPLYARSVVNISTSSGRRRDARASHHSGTRRSCPEARRSSRAEAAQPTGIHSLECCCIDRANGGPVHPHVRRKAAMSDTATVIDRTASTESPVLDVLAGRWSPRAYDVDAPIDETKLASALEAARWSPSANNTQPWRFIVARRGTAAHTRVHDAL